MRNGLQFRFDHSITFFLARYAESLEYSKVRRFSPICYEYSIFYAFKHMPTSSKCDVLINDSSFPCVCNDYGQGSLQVKSNQVYFHTFLSHKQLIVSAQLQLEHPLMGAHAARYCTCVYQESLRAITVVLHQYTCGIDKLRCCVTGQNNACLQAL